MLVPAAATAAFVLTSCDGPSPAPPPPASPATTPIVRDAFETTVRDELRARPAGPFTVATLGYPEAYEWRVVDRVVRERYFLAVPQIMRDAASAPDAPFVATDDLSRPAPAGTPDVRFVEHADVDVIPRRALPDAMPGRRSFRAFAPGVGIDPPDDLLDVARVIARDLVREGLAVTTIRAVRALPDWARALPGVRSRLDDAGLPVDLLEHFAPPDDAGAPDALTWLVDLASSTAADGDAERTARLIVFRFRPTVSGGAAMPDDGSRPATAVRVQLTRGTYWQGPGAGGNLDLVRQVRGVLPGLPVIASVEWSFADELRALVPTWPGAAPLTVVLEPYTVSQWAADNARVLATPSGGRVHLFPRYASRGEMPSAFVPGETYLAGGLAEAGERWASSPLLFQGGNFLVFTDGAHRRMLIGEAEIIRNRMLGLTDDQAIDALCAEFDVRDAIVLPSNSFHIDYDISVRSHRGRRLAFVSDRVAAATMIVAAGLEPLRATGRLNPGEIEEIRRALDTGRLGDVVGLLGMRTYGVAAADGSFPLSFAQAFAVDPVDSPVGNLHRFLLAIDVLQVAATGAAAPAGQDLTRAYYQGLHRAAEAERDLRVTLEGHGFDVIAVPSLAAGTRGVVPVNGLHLPDRYLMPAYGGLLADLDRAAQTAFSDALGPEVGVIPIRSGESMRRSGAVHCSVVLLP